MNRLAPGERPKPLTADDVQKRLNVMMKYGFGRLEVVVSEGRIATLTEVKTYKDQGQIELAAKP